MPDLSASGGSLRNLYLSHNKLGPLLEEVDAGLKDLGALSHLTLDHNALRDIAPEYFTSSASNRLYVLDLSHNDFPHIPAEVRSLHNLQSFSIGHNGIQELGSLSMEQLWRLQADHNAIEEISSLNFKDLRSLQVLDLASNSIRLIEANAFASNARLQAIRLDDNAVDSLHTELFAHLSNLTWLNLSSNSLSTFDYKLLPPSIQWLDLHDNALSSLDNHFSLQEQLPRLSHLDASFNRIREIGPQNILMPSSPSYSTTTIYPTWDHTPSSKRPASTPNALRLSSSSGGDAPDWFKNINSPSDGILHLQSYYPRIADLESIYCELIYSRVDRFVPLVEAESFLCSYDRHCFALCQCCEYDACDCEMTCPPGCTCYHDNPWAINIADCSFSGLYDLPERLPMDATEIFLDGNELSGAFKSHNFIGRKNLRDLYLNQSSLTLLPNNSFHGLHALLKLHLEDNNLSKLRGSEFSGLRSLVELYLHNNTLSVIAPNTFKGLESLRVLTLGDNRLASWTPWILNANPSLISVSLTGNPWDCECAFLKRFEHWLQGFKEEGGAILGGEDALRCVDGLFIRGNHCPLLPKESEERRRRVVHLSSSSSLFYSLSHIPGRPLGLSGTLLILSIVYRYEIRVWVFARTGHRLCDRMHHEVENNTLYSEKEKLYDAFFAYSSKDDVFVREVLAPELEHGSRLKLCLLYRDLSPLQMPVADSILSAWGSSRRRVLILSEHFLKSEWRRYNYKSGLHQAMGGTFKATSSHLIVIILGNVALRDLEPDIRHYFASCRTLRWGERMFWDKLRYFLPDLREGEGNGGRHSLEAIGLQDVPSFNSEASSNTIRTMTIHI
ncbi:Tolllike receptor 6 [Caligus rogercresseyi]|uniref:Tolllike receptor 6 n=1 Tax=Caligus rogercresseyi TaxID=217165 RepID=A0A7T8JTE8_CALRO|nr:Tolllike receptor 6 [Caligus rogercresseyi]